MLSDQGADLVMDEIELYTLILDQVSTGIWTDIELAEANAMLNHLYDLHKLRDDHFWSEMFSSVEHGHPLEDLLWEYYDA